MNFEKELFELQEYCKASANFITDNDSIEDRYARQAYKDVVNKIVGIFERALAENTHTSEKQLATPDVVKSVCVKCGKPIGNFDKDTNNCCDECWLSI
jgi:hypothetical protein